MEFTISENGSYPGPGAELAVQLYPTETTFVFLDRWREAYYSDHDLPYPADLIQSQDWQGINQYWSEHRAEIERSDEYYYIKDGTERSEERRVGKGWRIRWATWQGEGRGSGRT